MIVGTIGALAIPVPAFLRAARALKTRPSPHTICQLGTCYATDVVAHASIIALRVLVGLPRAPVRVDSEVVRALQAAGIDVRTPEQALANGVAILTFLARRDAVERGGRRLFF
jgi:hypothetical protein